MKKLNLTPFFSTKWGHLHLKPEFKDKTSNLFNKEDNEYVLNINPKKHLMCLDIPDNCLKKANIFGILTFNLENVSFFNFYIHPTKLSVWGFHNWDYLNAHTLNISTEGKITLSIMPDITKLMKIKNQWDNNYQQPLKKINITAYKADVYIRNQKHLEEITIINKNDTTLSNSVRSYNWADHSSIILYNLPNLKKLDISKLNFKPSNERSILLDKLPDNCIIKLNPNQELNYICIDKMITIPKEICYNHSPNYNMNKWEHKKTFKLKEVFDSKDQNPITLTYKEYKNKIMDFIFLTDYYDQKLKAIVSKTYKEWKKDPSNYDRYTGKQKPKQKIR